MGRFAIRHSQDVDGGPLEHETADQSAGRRRPRHRGGGRRPPLGVAARSRAARVAGGADCAVNGARGCARCSRVDGRLHREAFPECERPAGGRRPGRRGAVQGRQADPPLAGPAPDRGRGRRPPTAAVLPSSSSHPSWITWRRARDRSQALPERSRDRCRWPRRRRQGSEDIAHSRDLWRPNSARTSWSGSGSSWRTTPRTSPCAPPNQQAATPQDPNQKPGRSE